MDAVFIPEKRLNMIEVDLAIRWIGCIHEARTVALRAVAGQSELAHKQYRTACVPYGKIETLLFILEDAQIGDLGRHPFGFIGGILLLDAQEHHQSMWDVGFVLGCLDRDARPGPVSYTHLTLPTKA